MSDTERLFFCKGFQTLKAGQKNFFSASIFVAKREPQSQKQHDQTFEGNLKPDSFYLHSGGMDALTDHVNENVQPSIPKWRSDGKEREMERKGVRVTHMQKEKERGRRRGELG